MIPFDQSLPAAQRQTMIGRELIALGKRLIQQTQDEAGMREVESQIDYLRQQTIILTTDFVSGNIH